MQGMKSPCITHSPPTPIHSPRPSGGRRLTPQYQHVSLSSTLTSSRGNAAQGKHTTHPYTTTHHPTHHHPYTTTHHPTHHHPPRATHKHNTNIINNIIIKKTIINNIIIPTRAIWMDAFIRSVLQYRYRFPRGWSERFKHSLHHLHLNVQFSLATTEPYSFDRQMML